MSGIAALAGGSIADLRSFSDVIPTTNPGHTLIVTRRHVESWFDATSEERAGDATG